MEVSKDRRTDICYLVSHGFAARMVFQTGLLQLLRNAGKRVAVVVSDRSDANLVTYATEQGVVLVEYVERKNIWNENFKVRRKYILEDVQSNPALLEKHMRAVKFNSSRHPWRRMRPYFHWLIYKTCQVFPGIRRSYLKYERRFLRSKEVADLLESLDPELVVSTYPVTLSEARFLNEARRLGIKTVIHLLSWDNITSKGRFPALADHYISWGPVMTDELKTYYSVDNGRIYETGVPHFDLHLETARNDRSGLHIESLGLDATKPYLFFGMSAPRFTPQEIDIVERLAWEVESNRFGHDMQLVIRPHPQNVTGNMSDPSWLKRLNELRSKRVILNMPDILSVGIDWSLNKKDMIVLSELMSGSVCIMNSGSTIAIEGLVLNRPVIITSFDGDEDLPYWISARRLVDYTHLSKLVRTGGVSVVRSYEQLFSSIRKYQSDRHHLKEERQLALKAFCRTGGATPQVAACLLTILEDRYKGSLEREMQIDTVRS